MAIIGGAVGRMGRDQGVCGGVYWVVYGKCSDNIPYMAAGCGVVMGREAFCISVTLEVPGVPGLR